MNQADQGLRSNNTENTSMGHQRDVEHFRAVPVGYPSHVTYHESHDRNSDDCIPVTNHSDSAYHAICIGLYLALFYSDYILSVVGD